MTGRRLCNVIETMFVETVGPDALAEYLDPAPPVDEVAVRRMANVVAAIELGAEVG